MYVKTIRARGFLPIMIIDYIDEESFLVDLNRETEGTPLAGGHLNMTKPALISQTNKRGTVTLLNCRVGRIRITRP